MRKTKYSVCDKVRRAWRPEGDIGVIEKIDTKTLPVYYYVKFPRCEDWFGEKDLIPVSDEPKKKE